MKVWCELFRDYVCHWNFLRTNKCLSGVAQSVWSCPGTRPGGGGRFQGLFCATPCISLCWEGMCGCLIFLLLPLCTQVQRDEMLGSWLSNCLYLKTSHKTDPLSVRRRCSLWQLPVELAYLQWVQLFCRCCSCYVCWNEFCNLSDPHTKNHSKSYLSIEYTWFSTADVYCYCILVKKDIN